VDLKKEEKKFDWKSFISFGLLFSFIIMSITGIVLYIAPPGRVAKWIIWTFVGLEKGEWEAVHTIFSYIFFILGIFHAFTINWKSLVFYFKKKKQAGLNKKKELIAMSIILLFSYFGTIYEIQPFKSVMDLGEYVKESWEEKGQEAPMSRTYAMSISELSEMVVDLSPQEIIVKLKGNSINVINKKQNLADLGKENNISPYDIYKLIIKDSKVKKQTSSSLKSGSGFGRKRIDDIAEILNVDVAILINRLKKAGIDAKSGDKIKNIAESSGKRPMGIVDILKNEQKNEIKEN